MELLLDKIFGKHIEEYHRIQKTLIKKKKGRRAELQKILSELKIFWKKIEDQHEKLYIDIEKLRYVDVEWSMLSLEIESAKLGWHVYPQPLHEWNRVIKRCHGKLVPQT